MRRGDVWLHRFGTPDKRRPVVVLTRDRVIQHLNHVVVAPITSTIRGIPSQVRLGVEDGMKRDCAVSLDHVQTVKRSDLRRWVARLNAVRMARICQALAIATGCDGAIRDEASAGLRAGGNWSR